MTQQIVPLIAMPQGAEWLVILAIVVLVFGAAKIPDLARGMGQGLRIFKAETKGLTKDDGTTEDAPVPPASQVPPPAELPPGQPHAVDLEAEHAEHQRDTHNG